MSNKVTINDTFYGPSPTALALSKKINARPITVLVDGVGVSSELAIDDVVESVVAIQAYDGDGSSLLDADTDFKVEGGKIVCQTAQTSKKLVVTYIPG